MIIKSNKTAKNAIINANKENMDIKDFKSITKYRDAIAKAKRRSDVDRLRQMRKIERINAKKKQEEEIRAKRKRQNLERREKAKNDVINAKELLRSQYKAEVLRLKKSHKKYKMRIAEEKINIVQNANVQYVHKLFDSEHRLTSMLEKAKIQYAKRAKDAEKNPTRYLPKG